MNQTMRAAQAGQQPALLGANVSPLLAGATRPVNRTAPARAAIKLKVVKPRGFFIVLLSFIARRAPVWRNNGIQIDAGDQSAHGLESLEGVALDLQRKKG